MGGGQTISCEIIVLAGQCYLLERGRSVAYVRFGSLADIVQRPGHVCFTPNSGHSSVQVGCPKSANCRHERPFGAAHEKIGEPHLDSLGPLLLKHMSKSSLPIPC